jgi:prevent-host-death family protein
MADTVNIYEAKSRFSQLLARVERGEEITIARHGRPVARLVPFVAQRNTRRPGFWRGRVKIAPGFDDFSDVDARDWYGS